MLFQVIHHQINAFLEYLVNHLYSYTLSKMIRINYPILNISIISLKYTLTLPMLMTLSITMLDYLYCLI
jgi:hypothetical protein